MRTRSLLDHAPFPELSTKTVASQGTSSAVSAEVGAVVASVARVVQQAEQHVPGSKRVAELAMIALAAKGHILLDDVPGTGKTTFAKTFAASLGVEAKRLQCTPDLMPGDVTGVGVLSRVDNTISFRKGPVFANVLLADELNRATPRAQSALLEAMAERQVTIDGVSYPLPDPFLVIATQNPAGSEGTYNLPDSQLDRFAISTTLGYPSLASGTRMLLEHRNEPPLPQTVMTSTDLSALIDAVQQVHVEPSIAAYVWSLAAATRANASVAVGASPRAALSLLRCAAANALLANRQYVSVDDVKALAIPCFRHRIRLTVPAHRANCRVEQVICDVLGSCPVPSR